MIRIVCDSFECDLLNASASKSLQKESSIIQLHVKQTQMLVAHSLIIKIFYSVSPISKPF